MRSLDQGRSDPLLAPDSTPVLFFGGLETAEVITVGINPSGQEFLSPAGAPLQPNERRFLHASELSGDAVRDADAALAKMRSYFSPGGNPYWKWFKPIDVLVKSLGASLEAGTAAHTDVLSCFATLKGWGRLKAPKKKKVSQSGFETFRGVLAHARRLRLLIIIGATAIREFASKAQVEFEAVPTCFDGLPKMAARLPVLSQSHWRLDGREVAVVAARPYQDRPLLPLKYSSQEESEVAALGRRIREVVW
ncbi:MAG TPA: hypothetical protein VNN21_07615 [Dehalococcoidia bacterium]|nr:hypothetical protein [Dehalococcoidia bacterium]